MLVQITNKQLDQVRTELKQNQNNKCLLCERDFDYYDLVACVDHQHYGNELIRGCLCLQCNRIEGVIWKYAQQAKANLPNGEKQWLNNLIKYLDQETRYIHPSAIPKPKKIKKSSFNKMVKLFNEKYPNKKSPVYPKSGKLTKKTELLFQEFRIQDYFYKS